MMFDSLMIKLKQESRYEFVTRDLVEKSLDVFLANSDIIEVARNEFRILEL